MIAGSALPDCPAKAAATAERVVAHGRSCRVLLPRLAVLARRNDGFRSTRHDGSMTGAGVVGTVGCDDTEGLVVSDLLHQVRQHGFIANATAGDLDTPDFWRISINPEVNLGPVPWPGRPVFLG